MKPTQIKQPSYDFQKYVTEIERDLAQSMGPAIDDLRKLHGDKLANEVMCSVCALLTARAVGMQHVWTGEPLDKAFKRFLDAATSNLVPTLKKITDHLANKKELVI